MTSNSSQWTAAAAAAAYFTNPQPAPVYCEGEHVVGRHARVVSSSSSSSQTCTLKQHSVADVKSDEEELAQWVRGLSPEGYTYYYNTSTGGIVISVSRAVIIDLVMVLHYSGHQKQTNSWFSSLIICQKCKQTFLLLYMVNIFYICLIQFEYICQFENSKRLMPVLWPGLVSMT